MPQTISETASVLAGMTGLALVMTWPLVRVAATAVPNDPGDPLLNAWILAWDAERMAHGLRGLWDLPAFFPYPHTLTFTEHLLGIAALVAPIYWFTRNAVLAYNAAFLLSFVVAGAAMYGLARSLTGRRDAAWVAGIVYAFCPYRMGMLSHLQVLWWGWLAATLWALHAYFNTRSTRALAAFIAAFLLQALSNGYFLYFSLVPIAIVGGVEWWRTRPPAARFFRDVAIASVAVAIVIAPIAVTYWRTHRDQHLVRSYEEIDAYHADVGSYLHAPDTVVLWSWLPGPARLEGDLFPGLTALILAAMAWRRRPHAPSTVAYTVVLTAGFVLSLGPEPTVWGIRVARHAPYEWMMRVMPGFNGLRVPARFSVLVFLSLATLAGIGAATALERLNGRRRVVVAALLSLAVLVEAHAAPIPIAVVPPMSADDRGAYQWLRAEPAGGTVEFPLQRPLSHSPLVYRARDPRGYLNTLYQFRTLFHHHAIVNGHSGYEPLLNVLLRREIDEHQLSEALLMLRSVGVRYAIVHPPESSTQPLARVAASDLIANGGHVAEVIPFGGTTAFRLRPFVNEVDDSSRVRPVPRATYQLNASEAVEHVRLMSDGDDATRWSSVGPQAGREWIQVDFDRPRTIARVEMSLAADFSDYPRWLVVEGVRSDGSRLVVFDGSPIPFVARGVLRNPAQAPIALPLKVAETISLRIRQTGRSPVWHWSVHELTVWERFER